MFNTDEDRSTEIPEMPLMESLGDVAEITLGGKGKGRENKRRHVG